MDEVITTGRRFVNWKDKESLKYSVQKVEFFIRSDTDEKSDWILKKGFSTLLAIGPFLEIIDLGERRIKKPSEHCKLICSFNPSVLVYPPLVSVFVFLY